MQFYHNNVIACNKTHIHCPKSKLSIHWKSLKTFFCKYWQLRCNNVLKFKKRHAAPSKIWPIHFGIHIPPITTYMGCWPCCLLLSVLFNKCTPSKLTRHTLVLNPATSKLTSLSDNCRYSKYFSVIHTYVFIKHANRHWGRQNTA